MEIYQEPSLSVVWKWSKSLLVVDVVWKSILVFSFGFDQAEQYT
jgi:hypothetical protein